jgi:uncharacterized protein YbaR (Trm112 family)
MSSLLDAHLHLLVCPACHASLRLEGATVVCTVCGLCYPIIDGLPVLIVSRAVIPSQR